MKYEEFLAQFTQRFNNLRYQISPVAMGSLSMLKKVAVLNSF